jgi:hypothetical protein
MHYIEVYKEAKRFATELQVRKELGPMDRADSVYGFDLNDDQAGNEQVHTIAKFSLLPR